MPTAHDSNLIFVLCGPAGSGKSSICRQLLARQTDLFFSVSTTTRQPREGEVDGVQYHFVTNTEFETRVQKGCFIEHAIFSGNRYGTEKRNVQDAQARGCDLLLDIEVQGVTQLKQLYGPRVITVFVFPPSFDILAARLEERGSESAEQLALRLKTAEDEMRVLCSPGFSDYLLINDSLDQAVTEAVAIVTAERLRFENNRSNISRRIITGLRNS